MERRSIEPKTRKLKPISIFVEGKDDERFFEAFISHFLRGYKDDGYKEEYLVESVGGKDNFFRKIQEYLSYIGEVNLKRLKVIGIVRDADENSQSAFQSICDVLKKLKLPVPTGISNLEGQDPAVCVLIIPPDRPGSLETICWESINDDKIKNCIEEYIRCINYKCSLSKNKLDKLRSNIFVCSKEPSEPNLRFGEAAEKGYFNFNAEKFEIIRRFLSNLFNSKGL